MTDIQKRLFALQDPGYKAFHCKLMPTVDPNTVIGVRTPLLRALARELSGTPQAEAFLTQLPHQYYDENNLHGFLLERCKDFDRAVALVDEFLPYVDNWATCDLCSPKVFRKRRPQLLAHIRRWMESSHTYTVRFGMEMLMTHFLDEDFQEEYLAWVAAARSEEYYVNMMIAWFFATALTKQYDAALPYIEQRRLDPWTHNKAIQKARESYRVPAQHKDHLNRLKVRPKKEETHDAL